MRTWGEQGLKERGFREVPRNLLTSSNRSTQRLVGKNKNKNKNRLLPLPEFLIRQDRRKFAFLRGSWNVVDVPVLEPHLENY